MRPTSLDRFRVQSPRPAYEANARNVNEGVFRTIMLRNQSNIDPNTFCFFFLDSVDCGIKVLKCCNTPRWRKLGTTKTFLTVLILLAIVQGISEKFISISAQQAALEHDYDPDIVGKYRRVFHKILVFSKYFFDTKNYSLTFFQSGCLFPVE